MDIEDLIRNIRFDDMLTVVFACFLSSAFGGMIMAIFLALMNR